jgi:ATP/maltotriose-dependent transcriptional regulator MalT
VVSRPGLFGRLGASARVTVVSAPPGSGKTMLLRSWVDQPGQAESAAWVPVGWDRHPAARTASISQVVDLLAQANGPAAPPALPCEALTRSEVRVLRYLPTNLSTREIAAELYLSTNTVKTHQRHLYQKLGASSRTEAVEGPAPAACSHQRTA